MSYQQFPPQPPHIQQPQYSQPQQPTDPTHAQPPARPRKKRRIFLWVFLAIQAIFIIWMIYVASSSTGASQSEIAQTCANGKWYPLWKSYADCAQHSGVVAAHDVGKGLLLTMSIVAWVVVDFLVGITYAIYKLAKR